MNEKPVKVDIDFNEALRRIAKTPKGVVDDNNQPKQKSLVNKDLKVYNDKEADSSPPPVKPK
jgi:ABC-type Fe3+-citrate transport system substrate-binding protein